MIATGMPVEGVAELERCENVLSPLAAGWRRLAGENRGGAQRGQERVEDESWLARIRHGDEAAARAFVERLYPTVLKSVRCHLPRQSSEDDLVQAVFSKVFAKLHQFSGLVPLEHWVSRITVNTCLTQLSREKARPELRMSDLSEEEQSMVERLLSCDSDLPAERSHDARDLLEKLMAALNADERLVVTLLHLEERSVAEISRLTSWSVSRVKVKAFRAREKMRKTWQKLSASTRRDQDAVW